MRLDLKDPDPYRVHAPRAPWQRCSHTKTKTNYEENIIMNNEPYDTSQNLKGVAIIGMAGRFPKAKNIDEFWRNIENGVDCITFYTDEELTAEGIDPETLKNPNYVKAKGEVENVDMFDAPFFGINPREAEVTDPQHRMLLECAWEALEHAGYDSSKYDGSIGVYAGKSMDYYLLLNVYPYIKKEISAGSLQAAIGNDKDSLTTTISYKLSLTGPAITIQTSSSTSLVAVYVACQSLLTYQCDIALAGGITAGPPIKSGYLYQEGGIWSPDGYCRAFDAKAKGFVPGSGMGLVTLKRLADAVRDGDQVWAVIKGFAVNNDGSKKVSYSAPSVDAQSEVVILAMAAANVHPETIQYIETHGTGTDLGDPIEITALTQAFRTGTSKKQFCAIGSLKSNIGHLDNAAGVAGLIKVALSLKYKKIPASLHYESPNPKIDFADSPFFVNTKTRQWQRGQTPRRAGVTSLGMGGTNAHVILEEAPEQELSGESREWQLLMLSAKTPGALSAMTRNLANYLTLNPGTNLADITYTLSAGRRDFDYRRATLSRSTEDARRSLENPQAGPVYDAVYDAQAHTKPQIVFMFSGQGSQYVNMGKGLYRDEPVFRENIDKCAEYLTPILGQDLRQLIYPNKEADIERNAEELMKTRTTQPALFMIEYALARLWMHWGVKPAAMIGHSIGEFAAACISGCFSLEDALKIVAARGAAMQNLDEGAMLSVGISEAEITGMLGEDMSLAAINSPHHCLVSGKIEAVERLEKQLRERSLFCRRLKTSHAFHSPMMEPIMDKFAQLVGTVNLESPRIPFISGMTGSWITPDEVKNPRCWAQQLRQPVRFSDGIRVLLKEPGRILLEVGPGNSLCVLARQQKPGGKEADETISASVRHINQGDPDMAFILKTLARLWLSGVNIDWKNYYKHERRIRVPLPTYPFERKRYWLEGAKQGAAHGEKEIIDSGVEKEEEMEAVKQVDAEAALGRTFQPRPPASVEYAAPTNAIEESIVEIWEDILGIKPIGINDNFFDLGGHSLIAALFLSQLKEKFQVKLGLRVIFEVPTITAIARLVMEQKDKPGDEQELDSLLTEIEGLSQEEIDRALSEEKQKE